MRANGSFLTRRSQLLSALLAAGLLLAVPSCQPAEDSSQAAVLEEAGPAVLVQGQLTQRSEGGMVVSANSIASRVGAEVLMAGGNAVDAAVATGFALAVVHPTAGNIGGGGFMVVRFPDGRTTSLDFREKAPLAAHPEMFLDESGEYSQEIHHNSHVAVGVPGTVAGFAMAHERYGTGDWGRLVEPGVALAGGGFNLSEGLSAAFNRVVRSMERYPASLAKFTKDGQPFSPGDLWVQPDLALTLRRIRDQGRDGFYGGETARLLTEEIQRGGGLITEEDLALFRAQEVQPVHGTYEGYEVTSMPPPSSGGIALVEMLNILEGFDLGAMGHNSAGYVHHLTEAMRLAFRDRARYLADADFADSPIDHLTNKEYAEILRAEIDSQVASTSSPAQVLLGSESMETTHYSVVDASGMAVSVTYTLASGYGSKIVVPGAGFLLNNEMGDFNAAPGLTTVDGLIGTEPNLARPQQRMLSSMTPTILAKDGELVAVIGSPGGRTIINTVLQVALNLMEFEMDIQSAVDASRIHHQWLPDQLRVEAEGFSSEGI